MLRSYIVVVILCCLHGITMGIANSSYSKENSEIIEIAPVSSNLFPDTFSGKNDLSTEINLRVNDEHNNGFVLFMCKFGNNLLLL